MQKTFEKKFLEVDFVLNNFIETKTFISKGMFNIESIECFEKDFPDEIEKIEETPNKVTSENDLKKMKTDFPDKRKL